MKELFNRTRASESLEDKGMVIYEENSFYPVNGQNLRTEWVVIFS